MTKTTVIAGSAATKHSGGARSVRFPAAAPGYGQGRGSPFYKRQSLTANKKILRKRLFFEIMCIFTAHLKQNRIY
jgi:hypothetical protein